MLYVILLLCINVCLYVFMRNCSQMYVLMYVLEYDMIYADNTHNNTTTSSHVDVCMYNYVFLRIALHARDACNSALLHPVYVCLSVRLSVSYVISPGLSVSYRGLPP